MPYSIGTRVYTGPAEYDFSGANASFYTELEHLQCLAVIGEHALKVLQGQLSNDVFMQDKTTLQHHLLCNLKGELIAKIQKLTT